MFQLCDISSRQRYILEKKGKSSKESSVLWSTNCTISSKLLIKRVIVHKVHYRNRKLRLDLQSQKKISLLITITISLNIQTDKFVYRSDLETTIFAYFPSKNLNYTAIKLFLKKLSTLNIAKFTIFTRTDFKLQTSVKKLRAITMYSAFTPECECDKKTSNLIGDVYFSNRSVRVKFCRKDTKRLFNFSAEAIINVRIERLCARCAIFLLKIKQNPFFDVWPRNLHF